MSKVKGRKLPFSKYKFKHQIGSSIENLESYLTSESLDWSDKAAEYSFQKTLSSLPDRKHVAQKTVNGDNGMGRDLFSERVNMEVKGKTMY